MRTLFIAGSDTGIGKTRVTGLLAALLPLSGESVQIVKPVETGVTAGDDGDADRAAAYARSARSDGIRVETHTLRRFPEPLAPLAAAQRAGAALEADTLLAEIDRLPASDWRLIEGAGGLAVPLGRDGSDWSDFAAALPGAHVILVVPDRLGAINQARLTAFYAEGKRLGYSLWLNENIPVDRAVREANRDGVAGDETNPVFHLGFEAEAPEEGDRVIAWYRTLISSTAVSVASRRNGLKTH